MKHKVRITVDELGYGKVSLDGQDLSDMVTAIGVNTDRGNPTEVTLVLSHLDVDLTTGQLADVHLVERRLIDSEESERNPEGY